MNQGHMLGMMSAADMAKLESLSGAAFDREWPRMMISHHEGAIRMAKEEQTNGQNPAAVALAQKTQADQTVEIRTMKELLDAS